MQVKDCVITSFGLTETSSHGNVRLILARLRNRSRSSEGPRHHFFGPTEISSHGNIRLLLARPRNWSPHVKDLVINSFGPTVEFSHGNMWILMVRLRNRLNLPARFISPLLIDFQSPSHASSTTLFTGSRLVSMQVCWRGLARILPVPNY
jgi:hypothetical protein